MEPRLGVNIDHVATLRQLRRTPYPKLLEAARLVELAGAKQITVHLREDRRHIQPEDVKQLRAELRVALNLEMAATEDITRFACRISPDWTCLVPEKRNEVTTEGGLDLKKGWKNIEKCILKLKKSNIRVSLFVEPTLRAVRFAHKLGADAVELHTGRFALATQRSFGARSSRIERQESERIYSSALFAFEKGLHVHAGHGLDYKNVRVLSDFKIPKTLHPLIEEYNIGHAIVCRAVLVGLEQATREMVSTIIAP